MGQVIIDVPQDVNIKTTIESVEVANEILEIIGKRTKSDLFGEFSGKDDFEKKSESEKPPAILPPRRNNLKKDLEAVVGIWSDREESADEIARKIRDKNNGKI
ncbi:MAG: hypothetical protein M3405_17750 [Acidobacteriota bacterium]|jgi:hypothetical protein|nr:hypothetical protein [Acidobacteriota bacterium]